MRPAFPATAAAVLVTATSLGCTVTPVANAPDLHGATDIGLVRTEAPLALPRQVRFEADRPDATLLRLDDAGWSGARMRVGRSIVNEPAYRLVPVCVAPCDATLTPASWYVVGGDDIARTPAFRMRDDATTIRVKTGGSQTLRELGLGSTFGGVLLAVVGGAGVLLAGQNGDPTARTLSIDMLAVGAGALGVGVPLWLLNPPTRVAFEQ
jgi:hypothetical protein